MHRVLRAVAADPELIRQLCGWAWIRAPVSTLPATSEPRRL